MSDSLSTEERKVRDLARLGQDAEDFQNELAGRETGRRARFGPRDRAGSETVEKRRSRAFRDALERLLTDKTYRALYDELGTRLADAERAADQAIDGIRQRLSALDATVSALENNAARGPDGAPVFRYADGLVVDRSGRELPRAIADGIIWPPNSTSAEAWFDAQAERARLTEDVAQWEDYRLGTLGDIRDRYEDRDAPMSENDLRDALDAIESGRPQFGVSIAPLDIQPSQMDRPALAMPIIPELR